MKKKKKTGAQVHFHVNSVKNFVTVFKRTPTNNYF